MVDQKDLDIKQLRQDLLGRDPDKGDLAPGTAVGEMAVDAVTGLLPRVIWMAEMRQYYEHAKRRGEKFAIALLDLDNFKAINDTRGHQAGDEILRKFGIAVQKKFRAADIEGRYGGDEVIVLLTDFKIEESELRNQERKIVEEIESEIQSGVSLGMARWDGKEPLEDLIKRADQRLYEMKREKKGNV